VPRLRRWMPPTQLRKASLDTQEFAEQAHPSKQQTLEKIFVLFRVFRG
jgi:hypothetical protein